MEWTFCTNKRSAAIHNGAYFTLLLLLMAASFFSIGTVEYSIGFAILFPSLYYCGRRYAGLMSDQDYF